MASWADPEHRLAELQDLAKRWHKAAMGKDLAVALRASTRLERVSAEIRAIERELDRRTGGDDAARLTAAAAALLLLRGCTCGAAAPAIVSDHD